MPRGKTKTLAEEKAELDARIAKRVVDLLKARDAATDELQALGHWGHGKDGGDIGDDLIHDLAKMDEGILTSTKPRVAFATGMIDEGTIAKIQRQESEAAKEAARQQNAGYQRGGTLGTVTDLDIPDALRNARANLKGGA